MRKDRKKKLFHDKRKKRESYSSLEVTFLSIMMTLLGVLFGVLLCYCKINIIDSSDSKLQEVISTYNNIITNSYGDIDKDELANAAISGMVNSLDDSYSDFLSEDETKSFNESIGGYYEGLGITITKEENGNVKLMKVAKDSPAKKAGIKKDDILLAVDDKDASKMDIYDLSEYVSKAGKKELLIKVNRANKVLEFKVKRAKVEVDSVVSGTYGNIGYLDINNFALNTGKQFNTKLKSLKKKEIKGLIIDLRDNPGGHLGQVKSMVEPFFKKNTIIYQIKDKHGVVKVKTSEKDKINIPVVVLINENTASASEIVAACFKDNYKNVTLVGKTSYGKGTIQKEVKLSTGSSIKYTTQKWLTPKGVWLNHEKNVGLKPDVDVDICKDSKCEQDLQLEKAKEILKKSS